jgi:hypothetical protein
MIVDAGDSAIKIDSKDRAMVSKLILYTPADLTESTPSSTGFRNIEVSARMKSSSTINLSGDFDTISVYATSPKINLTKGSIVRIDIDSSAVSSVITLESNTELLQANINGKSTQIKGRGIVKSASVDADDVTLQRKPATISGSRTPKYVETGEAGTITIVVKNGNYIPVSGARVYVGNDNNYKTSGDDGKVTFNLDSGEYRLRIDHPSFDVYEATMTFSGTVSRDVSLIYRTRYDYTFIVEDSSRRPVSGASVRLGSGSSSYGTESTDGNGEARFPNIQAGVYDYSISSSAGSSSGKVTISSSGNKTISLSGSGGSSSEFVGQVAIRVANDTSRNLSEIRLTVELIPVYQTQGSTISRTFWANESVTIPTYMGEYEVRVTSDYGSVTTYPSAYLDVPDGTAYLDIRIQ